MLSFKECQDIGAKVRAEEKKRNEYLANIRKEELRKNGVNVNVAQTPKPKYDNPSMPEDGLITVLYIICMIASLIFNDFWMIWIALTLAYSKFITRHDNN